MTGGQLHTNYRQTTNGTTVQQLGDHNIGWRMRGKKIVIIRISELTCRPSAHQGPAAQIYKENGVGVWKEKRMRHRMSMRKALWPCETTYEVIPPVH